MVDKSIAKLRLGYAIDSHETTKFFCLAQDGRSRKDDVHAGATIFIYYSIVLVTCAHAIVYRHLVKEGVHFSILYLKTFGVIQERKQTHQRHFTSNIAILPTNLLNFSSSFLDGQVDFLS